MNPLIKKQNEKAAAALQEGLKQRTNSLSTSALRKVLVVKKKDDKGKKASAPTEDEEEVDMELEGDDEEEEAVTGSNSSKAKEEFIQKRKGSKPRNNPGKELVWF